MRAQGEASQTAAAQDLAAITIAQAMRRARVKRRLQKRKRAAMVIIETLRVHCAAKHGGAVRSAPRARPQEVRASQQAKMSTPFRAFIAKVRVVRAVSGARACERAGGWVGGRVGITPPPAQIRAVQQFWRRRLLVRHARLELLYLQWQRFEERLVRSAALACIVPKCVLAPRRSAACTCGRWRRSFTPSCSNSRPWTPSGARACAARTCHATDAHCFAHTVVHADRPLWRPSRQRCHFRGSPPS